MTPRSFTLALIAKNEGHVVRDMLDSVFGVLGQALGTIVLVDTGSTDSTVAQVTNFAIARGVRPIVERTPWTGFGPARTNALSLARAAAKGRAEAPLGGYTLMMDADDLLVDLDVGVVDFVDLADAFALEIRLEGTRYARTQIFSNAVEWSYRGVVHEFPEGGKPSPLIVGAILARSIGARSLDPRKYLHDTDTINEALKSEPDPFMRRRYCFYLAQSYRDASHSGAAIYWYKVVFEDVDQWSEQRYVACLNLYRLMGEQEWLFRATRINDKRAEAWRLLGYDEFADRCRIDPSFLFAESWAYKTGAPE